MKYAILCVGSHPVLRFEIRAIFVASRTKACKRRIFSQILHNDTKTVASQIGDREVNLRIELHISYTDQFVVPPIFKYLIGAKDVEIRLVRKFDSAERAPNTKVSIDLEFINPIWLGCLGCLDRLGRPPLPMVK